MKRYPAIRFTSTSVEAVLPDRYVVRGRIEIRGVTQPLVLNARLVGRHPDPARGAEDAEFVVTGTLRRSAFGMTADEMIISDKVNTTIRASIDWARKAVRAEPPLGWTRTSWRLDWCTAALVLLAFPLGWVMVGVPLNALLLKFALYQVHKTLGILVLVLTTTRLLVRARGGRPAWDAEMPDRQRRPASIMHRLLYMPF